MKTALFKDEQANTLHQTSRWLVMGYENLVFQRVAGIKEYVCEMKRNREADQKSEITREHPSSNTSGR